GSDWGSKRQKEGGEHASASTPSEKATRSEGRTTKWTQSRQMSANESALAEEPVQTTYQMEEPPHPVFETGADDQPIVQTSQHPECDLARQTDARLSFNELIDTPIDFFNFIMHRLNVDTLTPDLLAGHTYELMRGSCTSLTELEYHLEEVYKATADQLDWVNLEASTPSETATGSGGRSTTGSQSQQLSASESAFVVEPVQTTCQIEEPPHLVFETEEDHRYHRAQDYGWHDYKHLDWISVRRDDEKIYKFKEGDFKRLRLQDIEDMLLLLVQGKLSNLTVEERFAFNVSLRMFTSSIVIERRVEDLQLGVESYQKRLNLTNPDTYRTDLRCREAYTPYSNPRGFIYQNKDKKNRLMRIDELHEFSDGTLNDVRNALDDRLKGIQMQYLPTTIWRRGDKDRAAAMI
nr:hypothetical protein [Tanacetum cinerariifolium]